MQRRIDLLNDNYKVTITGSSGNHMLQVEAETPLPAELISTKSGKTMLKLGDRATEMEMAVKGEVAYIHAFGRSFCLSIIDPVEQASQEAGGKSNTARSPMPGIVVEVDVNIGDEVTKGQAMLTIESMKILTVITAPRDGEVGKIHFKPGDTFDKNAVLITLTENKEAETEEV